MEEKYLNKIRESASMDAFFISSDNEGKKKAFDKVKKTLFSSQNLDQLATSIKLINNFNKVYKVKENSPEYDYFVKIINVMKLRLRSNRMFDDNDLDESLNWSDKDESFDKNDESNTNDKSWSDDPDWKPDPIKSMWVQGDAGGSSGGGDMSESNELDWIKDVPSTLPKKHNRLKIDLIDFLMEVGKESPEIVEDLLSLDIIEPTEECLQRYEFTKEEFYLFDEDVLLDAIQDKNNFKKIGEVESLDPFLDNLSGLHENWEEVDWNTTDYDLERSSFTDRRIYKRKKDNRYFALDYYGDAFDGVNDWETYLYEVFPKKVTKTVYENRLIKKVIKETLNDFDWASDINWSKEMLDDMLSGCKTLRVANFNISKNQPYYSAGGPSTMFLTRCKEWWDYFGGLPLTDSGRGPAEWFTEDNYEDGEYGIIWNPRWARKKITPQLEDLKDEYTSAITTPWGWGIEKQLNGTHNGEAWFVVDENNKPMYDLIPNAVKGYAKIYEKEFFD